MIKDIESPVPFVLISCICDKCGDRYGITEDETAGMIINKTKKQYKVVTEGGNVTCWNCDEILSTTGDFCVQTKEMKWLTIKRKNLELG